jgi:peptidoglycan/xylan/chitin deacetylase (PgdA/CDA1 family)
VSAGDLVAWLGGRPLPPRSVLVTFDDSTKGTWVFGDPILAAAKFRALSFVVTGWVGTHQPYYLTWDELRLMYGSGRWDLESHSRLGHQQLPIDAAGTTAPALINRLWLPGLHRVETLDEFTARVGADLIGSKTDLADHGFPEPRLFAYPYSAFTAPTNDASAAERTLRFVHDLFAVGFINSQTTATNAPSDVRARTLRRLDVGTATTNEQLFRLVTSSTAGRLRATRPFGVPDRWTDTEGNVLASDVFEHGPLLPIDPTS